MPYRESFLLLGGDVGYEDSLNGTTDSIYKYEIFNDTWTLLDTKLPFNVSMPVALWVDIDIFPCATTTTSTTTTTTPPAESGARSIQVMELFSIACLMIVFVCMN